MPGNVTSITWSWPGPLWTAILLGAAAAAWVGVLYVSEQPQVSGRTRAMLAALRMAALALLLVMFGRPLVERSRLARPRLAIALDRSASMSTCDVSADQLGGAPTAARVTRIDAWRALLGADAAAIVPRINAHYDLDYFVFDDDAEAAAREELLQIAAPAAPEIAGANGRGRSHTRLGDAIDFVVRQAPGPRPAAVIVMSDGVNTSGLSLEDAGARARMLGVPVYTVAIGSDRPRPDVAVDNVRVEPASFPGDRLQVEATIRAAGYTGHSAAITLRNLASGAALAETVIQLPADAVASEVRLALRPNEPGVMPLSIEVEVQPDEQDPQNNRREFTVDVRSQPISTLLVAATPSFEYRALKSLLERDPAIALDVWLQDADANYAEVDPAAVREFPRGDADLADYDVVILGDCDPDLLPNDAWEGLRRFVVEQGGGMALVAGPRFMPTAVRQIDAMRLLLPVEVRREPTLAIVGGEDDLEHARAIVPTPAGWRDASLQIGETPDESQRVWEQLPPVTWMFDQFQAKPGAQVLAEGRPTGVTAGESARPAILRHYVGAGEVLMHLTDESWRWRWRNDDRYFARYWGQAVRRLARGKATRGAGTLATDRAEYREGEPVTLRARVTLPTTHDGISAADSLTVDLVGEVAAKRSVKLVRSDSPNLYETVVRGLPADRYTVRLPRDDAPGPTAEFRVLAPPSELAQLAVNGSGMAMISRTTGGKSYTVDTASRLPDELPQPQPETVERLPAEPLWNSPWLLGGLCATLGLEWFLRRRAGML